MTGAIEFVRKIKAVCNDREFYCGHANEDRCPVFSLCHENLYHINEADLVAKVMAYKIKEVSE